MKQVWTEERIRDELAKLDKITGLHGKVLPIIFNNRKRTLGMFSSQDNGKFFFSNHYFQDENWPAELAVETIRHEYAHYMDYELYGNLGHGPTWKACCTKVGIAASRLYNPKKEEYYHEKEAKEQAKLNIIESFAYGDIITHPRFGKGMIRGFIGKESDKIAVVDFDNIGIKRMSLLWIDEHCGRETTKEIAYETTYDR